MVDSHVSDAFVHAFDDYVGALGTLGPPVEVQELANTTYRAYLEALESTKVDPEQEQRVTEAYQAYADALRQTLDSDGLRAAFEDAYRQYVRAIQKAWSDVDVDLLDATTVASIGQSMISVASMMAAGDVTAS
jgi:hypothetical protein